MTWFLPEAQPSPVAPPRGPASSFAERFAAARTMKQIEDNSWSHALGVEDTVLSEFADQLKEFRDPNLRVQAPPIYGESFPTGIVAPARRNEVLAQIARARAADPVKWADLPKDAKELERVVMERRWAEYEEARTVLDRAPPDAFGAEFLGSSWAALTDETSLPSALLGGPAGKGVWGLIRMLGGEAAAGAASELAIAQQRQEVARDLDLPTPNVIADVAEGALTAAGFVGGIRGIARLPSLWRSGADRFQAYRAARGEAAAAARPEGVSPGSHEARIKAGGETLAGRAAPEAPEALPPISATAPANWQAIRGGIFAGESGGDYDALFEFSNRPGGPFESVKLTEMTVDQAVEFSAPRGAYAEWVRSRIGRTATPMGAYQIVGTTLRAAKKGLGLRGDELMTPDLQERLGQYIYKMQGTGAWEGYRGPNADFRPGQGRADFTPYQPTSRGYTGAGQVSVGDRRIDVEYVVVDASKLQKATGRFQPRDRSRITSDVWIAETAARLDPAQLMPSPTAATGAPIVGPDMIIESGNGRFAAIQRAYALHPDRAAAYRQQIEAAGFAVPEGVKEPVLVARRKTPMNDDEREQFAIDAQDAGVARMTATEIAAATARQMTPERLALFQPGELMSSEANKPFMKAVLAALPRSERNAIFGEDGALNADGRRKVRDAFFSRAWNDDGPIGRMVLYQATEAEDKGELKTLLDALDEAAPAWATLKADIASGAVRPEFDITANVLDALNAIALARRDAGRLGASITEIIETLVSTEDMFDAINPLSLAMLRKFWHDGRPASAKSISGFLNRYAAEARTVGRIEDKLAADVGPAQVLRLIDKSAFGDLPDAIPPIARRISDEVANPVTAPDLPETAFANGADSPEAEAADAAAMDDLLADGPFGPRHFDIVNDPQAAIDRLMAEKAGEVPAAMNREDLGDIAFVYGTKAFGLRHIEAKHPEMLARLPELLQDGTLVGRAADRAYIQLPDAAPPSAVIRLDWDGAEKAWLVTAFDDAEGQVARQLQISNEPTASASSRIPDATGPAKDSVVPAENQDDLAAAIATARAEFDELGDFELPDGTRARDLLDDIDEDQQLEAAVTSCMTGGGHP